jgi:hypothetical protein
MTVSAAVNAYTANYSFRLINFNYPRWHTEEWKNWQNVDAVLRSIGAVQSRGVWENSISYLVGDRVIDEVTGLIWICEVAHTSSVSGDFATARTNFPTYWDPFTTVPNYRGAWVAANSYAIGDIVVVNGGTWYFCIEAHTASGSFATDANKWETIFDITTFTNYYYGGRSSETSLRPDGTASQAGDTYYNSTSNLLRLYNGSAWVNYNTAGTAASGITVTPVGNITSTDAQNAFQELDGEITSIQLSFVPNGRTVTAGAGLTGGGNLTSNISLAIDNLGVTKAMLAADSVDASKIEANAVGASELADNAVDTAAIVNDAVTYDKIQNITATQRVLGRNSGGAGNAEEVTVAQVLDWLGTTRGSIAYRGAAAWTPLVPVAAGYVLRDNGVGADPSWVGGMTLLNSGTASAAATLDITLPTGYRYWKLILGPGFYPSTDGTTVAARLSFDNGATFSALTYSWAMFYTSTAAAATTGGFSNNDAGTFQGTGCLLSAFLQDNGRTDACWFELDIYPGSANFGTHFRMISMVLNSAATANGVSHGICAHGTDDVPDAVRILYNSGNLNGPWALYGVS